MCTDDIPEPFTSQPYNPIDQCGHPRFKEIVFLPLPHQLDISFDRNFHHWQQSNSEWMYKDDDNIQIAFKYFIHSEQGRVWNGREWVIAPLRADEAPSTPPETSISSPIYIKHLKQNRLICSSLSVCIIVLGFGLCHSFMRHDPGPQRINVNTATAGELTQLPGVGSTLAQRIIDNREQYGPIKNKRDLSKIEGIGEKKAEALYYFIVYEIE